MQRQRQRQRQRQTDHTISFVCAWGYVTDVYVTRHTYTYNTV